MIATIRGKVTDRAKNSLIIEVGGLGFRVAVPLKTLEKYGKQGLVTSLFTHTYIRQDQLALYGFESMEELQLFEQLMTVSGIGAKLSLTVCSSGSPDEIRSAVANSDVSFFESISGIGKKSARRIVVDLKSLFGDEREIDFEKGNLPSYAEAIEALKHFGFSRREAQEAIRSLGNAASLTSGELVKQALKQLGS